MKEEINILEKQLKWYRSYEKYVSRVHLIVDAEASGYADGDKEYKENFNHKQIDKDWYTLNSKGNPIYINDLKKSIQFNLEAYNNNTINAEDCVQAIDEIVNGVTKPPMT